MTLDDLSDAERKAYVRKVAQSYIVDILLCCIMFIPAVLGPWTKPFTRPIDPNDPKISFPFEHSEMFPPWSLPLICFGLPALVIFIVLSLQKFQKPRLFVAFVALLLSVSLTDLITNVIKNFTGKLRPDFLARCQPIIDTVGNVTCKQRKLAFLWEGRKSFPSGHASTSFAGLGLLSLFLTGQLRTYNGKGFAANLILAVLPLILAAIVAISRVNDYRHHWEDVLAGSLLGTLVSLFAYRLYFPFPASESGDEPLCDRFERIKSKSVSNQTDAVASV